MRSYPHLWRVFHQEAPKPGPAPVGIRTFRDGGYTVVREPSARGEFLLVLDHGPLGYLSIAAHGHADALAIWLHLAGCPVIVDAGTYLYHSGGAWRDHRSEEHTSELQSLLRSSYAVFSFIKKIYQDVARAKEQP